jgi:hypothetical protein
MSLHVMTDERSGDVCCNLANLSSHVCETHGLPIDNTVMILSLLWMSLDNLFKLHYRFQLGRSNDNILDMVFGSQEMFKTMSHAETDSDSESDTERDLVTEYPQEIIAKRTRTDRAKWYGCRSWDDAMELNRQFFSGGLQVNISDSFFDPRDMENDVLQKLLETIYIIRHYPRGYERRYTQDGEIFITRQLGSCCFMLSCEHKLLAPLMNALLGSRQLHTVVMQRGNDDIIANFDCEIRVQDIKSRSSSDDLDLWTPFATESPGEIHSELYKKWEDVRGFSSDALVSCDPVLFGVTTREYETDVLDLLSEIVEEEVSRHSFDYVAQRYRLV